MSAPRVFAGEHPVSPRQLQILRIIERWVADCGFPPTYREFAIELGLSTGSRQAVAEHLARLVAKQLLVRRARTARGLSLTAAARELLAREAQRQPMGATT